MKIPVVIARFGHDKVIAVALAAFFFAVYFTIGLPILGPLVSHHMTIVGAEPSVRC